MVRSAFRYPGSKEKIAADVMRWFPARVTCAALMGELSCYCEPFIGCGAVAVRVLPLLTPVSRVVLADKDAGIVDLWRAVLTQPAALVKRLLNFTPSVEAFQLFKAEDGAGGDPLESAFRKFALHQMSFSGLGAMAGGPIGGADQGKAAYRVDCRFRPERHAKVIMQQHKLLKRFASVELIHGDYAKALERVPDDGFAYLDPPYYLKGGELYKHNMTPGDHERLAVILRGAGYEWALSYDDHAAVREMYREWSDIHEFEMVATIDTKKGSGSRRKNNELIIAKREPT
jgi:DNA adenine methylase